MKRVRIELLLLVLALLVTGQSLSRKPSNLGTYSKIGEFQGGSANISVKLGEIREYILEKKDINRLDSVDRMVVEKYMPGWKGERFHVSLYKWTKDRFALTSKYYANDSVEASVRFEDYDESGDRNVEIPGKYKKHKNILSCLTGSLVKSYAEGDLNGDGKTDFVIVYQDTVDHDMSMTAPATADCNHMVIYEAIDDTDYVNNYQYDFLCDMVYVGKIEIRDITRDKVPEIILWYLGMGTSGFTTYASIFTYLLN